MRSINRRDLFVGAGGLVTSLLVRRSVAEATSTPIPPAPVARVAVVKDTYFGETLSDPYRWMENDKDPEWLPFLNGQNAHARALLDTIPGRAALLQRIQQLSGDTAVTRARAARRRQALLRAAPAGRGQLQAVRAGGRHRPRAHRPDAQERRQQPPVAGLVDQPRPTASAWSYGLSKDGSEDSVLHVLNVADGKDLPETIPNTEGAQSAMAR